MKKTLQLVCVMLASLSLYACGTSTATSVTPATILNSDAIPSLGGILSTNTYGGATLVSGFTEANPYWVFNANTFAGSYSAPADGYVARVGVAQLNGVSVTYVTLIHSGRVATRVFGMQNVILRPGDTVLQGSLLGTYSNSGQVAFQVLVDNTPVCPLSYMTRAFRTSISATGYYTQLCN